MASNSKPKFAQAKIKKMLQVDEDMGKVASGAPVVISRALEMFISALTKQSCEVAEKAGSRTLSAGHLYVSSIHLPCWSSRAWIWHVWRQVNGYYIPLMIRLLHTNPIDVKVALFHRNFIFIYCHCHPTRTFSHAHTHASLPMVSWKRMRRFLRTHTSAFFGVVVFSQNRKMCIEGNPQFDYLKTFVADVPLPSVSADHCAAQACLCKCLFLRPSVDVISFSLDGTGTLSPFFARDCYSYCSNKLIVKINVPK